MQTRALRRQGWSRRGIPARDRVFAEVDPFGAPFTDGIVARALLFPISYELEHGQIAALADAAQALGDETIFLEVVELAEEEPGRYWESSTDGRGPYDVVENPGLETALFSPAGTWGMLISHEDHAVVGGPAGFVQMLAEHFPATELPTQNFFMGAREPEWPEEGAPVGDVVDALTAAGTPFPLSSGQAFGDGQVLAFLDFWKGMRDWSGRFNDWLAPHLHHLFGEREAERLLAEGGWWA
jgi:hypothetical protein